MQHRRDHQREGLEEIGLRAHQPADDRARRRQLLVARARHSTCVPYCRVLTCAATRMWSEREDAAPGEHGEFRCHGVTTSLASFRRRKSHWRVFALSCIVAGAHGRERARGDGDGRRSTSLGRAGAAGARAGFEPLAALARRTPRPPSSPAASRPPKPPSAASASPSPSMARRRRPSGSSRSTSSRASSPRAEWERLSAGLEQRVRAINAFIDDVYGARKILADGVIPADIVLANPQFCIPVRRRPAAARRLRPYLRDRPGPHRPGRILRAGGQCPHAVRRLLHARESRGDAPALPGIVRHLPGAAGRFLSRAAARDALFGRARAARASRAACC